MSPTAAIVIRFTERSGFGGGAGFGAGAGEGSCGGGSGSASGVLGGGVAQPARIKRAINTDTPKGLYV